MKTYGFAIDPSGEPAWTHRGSKHDPCGNMWSRGLLQGRIHRGSKQDPYENIWFREICMVGSIVDPSRIHRTVAPVPIKRQGSEAADPPALLLL